MLNPWILQEVARARRADLLADAETRRLVRLARANRPPAQLSVRDWLVAFVQRLQETGQRVRDRQAVYAFKQDGLPVTCEDPACAC